MMAKQKNSNLFRALQEVSPKNPTELCVNSSTSISAVSFDPADKRRVYTYRGRSRRRIQYQ